MDIIAKRKRAFWLMTCIGTVTIALLLLTNLKDKKIGHYAATGILSAVITNYMIADAGARRYVYSATELPPSENHVYLVYYNRKTHKFSHAENWERQLKKALEYKSLYNNNINNDDYCDIQFVDIRTSLAQAFIRY